MARAAESGCDELAASLVIETARRASAKCWGNSRPRFSARLRIPAAALGLKKYLGATSSSSTSRNDEDAPPALGHSEVSAVQDSPGEVVKPEVGQRREKDGEISATVAGKKSGNVLNEEPSPIGENKVSDPGVLEEEAAALACEPGAASGDAEVLAGEASADEINTIGASLVGSLPPFRLGECGICRSSSRLFSTKSSYIGVAGGVGEAFGEHASPPLVGFALPGDAHPCSFESEVDAADAREEASDIHAASTQ